MKKFFLITNAGKDPDFSYAGRLAEYIRAKGGEASFLKLDGLAEDYRMRLLEAIPKDTEGILVIGGDGTLIKAARDTGERQIPMLGINLGKLGYLCELDDQNVWQAIDQLMEDRFTIEERMMISAHVERNGLVIRENTALNDVVIHRSGKLHVISFEVDVSERHLSSYVADGIIIATPTGSTAYNMSAGGPIVEPEARMIVLTPINSHDLNRHSIVLDRKAELSIRIRGGRFSSDASIDVSFDGMDSVSLQADDIIYIRQADTSTKIIRLSQISFIEILQKKMQRYN